MIRAIVLAAALLCGMAGGAVHAQATPPDQLVRNVTSEVLHIVRTDKDLQAGDARRARDLVEAKVLPHFNFARMTALALGREWRQASPAQRAALTEEFRTLLVRTYSNALTAYKNQTVEFKPLRAQPGDTDVMVRTQVNQPGARPIAIDYALEKDGEAWKVYDVVVGGVSLVTNYRESFGSEVRRGGIDGLVRTLHAKNQVADETARDRK